MALSVGSVSGDRTRVVVELAVSPEYSAPFALMASPTLRTTKLIGSSPTITPTTAMHANVCAEWPTNPSARPSIVSNDFVVLAAKSHAVGCFGGSFGGTHSPGGNAFGVACPISGLPTATFSVVDGGSVS